ncbi:hypothetical protein NCS57_00373600 [Fusarium keratoplasticum]|uniref:Uncharacterized protein n=1 Tax=Fusarium keratoplasticum TaxID=1328300 RepID=A0ACC0R3J3_9HYPO|nr:hypothetical protein NCS57_00373600 [Fusarium keratoplasticum]KAI8674748.1 hypothetical protein NCS57_00373600 [Fusarium keratoplasticum]
MASTNPEPRPDAPISAGSTVNGSKEALAGATDGMAKVRIPVSEGDLVDVSRFRSTIAGFFNANYASSGDTFLESVREKTGMERTRMELDDLWLQVQFFHDSMLRIQPNHITINPENLAQAVDLILDVSHWRLKTELDKDLKEEDARVEITVLRRRLCRLELMLRDDLNLCGKPPKVLAGCIVGVKRPKYKDRLWTRLFGNEPGEQNRNEDRSFHIRDVASLLRIEDFLTFVSTEFDRQLGPRGADPQDGVIMAAIAHLDDEVKSFLKTKNCRTANELKAEWAPVLLNPRFRAAVTREMSNLVKEAVAFRKKNGYTTHREECELFLKPQGGIARVFSNVSMKGDSGRPGRSGSSLKPGFLRKDSATSKK